MPAAQNEIDLLSQKVTASALPTDLRAKAEAMIARLAKITESSNYSSEYDRLAGYIDWTVALPWQRRIEDNLDIASAKQIMDRSHYGLTEVKERLLEYLSVLKLKRQSGEVARAPIIALIGLAGTGKTSFAYAIAESLGRPLGRIPFGGLGDAMQLRGRSRIFENSEPGLIVKTLRRTGVKNPVILLDEIDRVVEESWADIMGVLVEVLDPNQNNAFLDHYIDYPVDLSEVFFIATANNTTKIATAVLDRLEVITMPSYTDEEKIKIGSDYILPRALSESGIAGGVVTVDPAVWKLVVRPFGFDPGMRSMERTIYGMTRKIAKMIVEGKGQSFQITEANVKEFLPTW